MPGWPNGARCAMTQLPAATGRIHVQKIVLLTQRGGTKRYLVLSAASCVRRCLKHITIYTAPKLNSGELP